MLLNVYAFSHEQEVVKESTSGGAFSAIAEAFFATATSPKKIVYGVTFNENMEVVYQAAHTLEQCRKFRGSKYVRSNLRGVPDEIARLLQDDYAVLFVGTPCYVYALKAKLAQQGVSTEHLLCVDLICHGTPEEKYWTAYKEWLEKKNKGPLTDFRFRSHLPNKSPYTSVAKFENGKVCSGTLETALFNRLFLRHYTMAEGCFTCRFATMERQGDLTIGDFWGIEKIMPEFCDDKAVSELLVHTAAGKEIAQWMLQNAAGKMQECCTMDFVQYQNNLQRPARKPPDLEQFRQDFQENGIGYVVRKYAGYDWLHRLKTRVCNAARTK